MTGGTSNTFAAVRAALLLAPLLTQVTVPSLAEATPGRPRRGYVATLTVFRTYPDDTYTCIGDGYNYYLFTGSDHTDGVSITWTPGTGSARSLNLSGVHFPQDVERNDNMILVRTDDNDGSKYVYMPVKGGLSAAQLTRDFVYQQHSVITWPTSDSLPCQPVAVFPGLQDFRIFAACINRTERKLWFTHVHIESDNISTWTLTPTAEFHEFDNLTTFSLTTVAHYCPGSTTQHHVFFISGRTVYAYMSADQRIQPYISVSENCSEPYRLKQDEENPRIVMVYCKGYHTEVIDYCDAKTKRIVEETLVPCSTDVTAYLNSSGVSISEVGSNVTSFIAVDLGPEGTQDAHCITADRGTVLVLALANSTVVVVDVSTQEVYHLGTTCTDDNRCPIPQVQGDWYVVYSNGTALLLFDVNCLEMRVTVDNSVPDVFGLYVPRSNQGPVPECLASSPTPMPSPPVVVVDGDSGSSDDLSVGAIAGIAAAAAVVVIGVTPITTTVLALLCCKRSWKRKHTMPVHARYNARTGKVVASGLNPTAVITQPTDVANPAEVKGRSASGSQASSADDITQLGQASGQGFTLLNGTEVKGRSTLDSQASGADAQSGEGSTMPLLLTNGTAEVKGHSTPGSRASSADKATQPDHVFGEGSTMPLLNGTAHLDHHPSPSQVVTDVTPVEDSRESRHHQELVVHPFFTVGTQRDQSDVSSDGSLTAPPLLHPTHESPSTSEDETLAVSLDHQPPNSPAIVPGTSPSTQSLSLPLHASPSPFPQPLQQNGYIPGPAASGGPSSPQIHNPTLGSGSVVTPSEPTSSSVPYSSSSSDQHDYFRRTLSPTPESTSTSSGPYVTAVAVEDTAVKQNTSTGTDEGAPLTPTVVGRNNPLSHRAASDTQVVNIRNQLRNPNDPQYTDPANERQRVLREKERKD